ncbi:hypothetical protein GCM10017744_100500 [Streptomyces antimycoticus]|uniref:Uncharacterized protein n=1 Tax=Streptomyces antimycoticus TaxID=68175 RepID=A0A4D4K178_9ACTN|nr:hypothetical protein SANT12839_012900 [Streptomyces antimycoticus]
MMERAATTLFSLLSGVPVSIEDLNAEAWTVYGQPQLDRGYMPPVPEDWKGRSDAMPADPRHVAGLGGAAAHAL